MGHANIIIDRPLVLLNVPVINRTLPCEEKERKSERERERDIEKEREERKTEQDRKRERTEQKQGDDLQ